MDVNTLAFGVVNAGSLDDGLTAVATLEPRKGVAPNLAVFKSSQTTIRHHDARVPAVVHFASPQDGIAFALDPHTRPLSARDIAVFQRSLSAFINPYAVGSSIVDSGAADYRVSCWSMNRDPGDRV